MARRASSSEPSGVAAARAGDGPAGDLAPRLAEAIAQRDAVADILRVIAESPTDPRPMAQAIAVHAARLCRAPCARVIVAEGGTLHAIGQYIAADGPTETMLPMPAGRGTVSGRAMAERRTIHLADVATCVADEFPDALPNWEAMRFRAVLAVPLLVADTAPGAIFLWRREPGLFADDQVALVETFARQAALAIANVRLFRETREALDQQTATSEILRAISRSRSDVQPVFESIVANALRLCDASFATIFRFDGTLIHVVAHHRLEKRKEIAFLQAYPARPGRGGATHRAILTADVVEIPDVFADAEYTHLDAARTAQFRAVLSVPMLRGGHPIGTITIYRETAGRFPVQQVALVRTFAEQAVIALDNAHLVQELEARNAALTETLGQKTATSEILRVIATSPTDPQPVFDLLAQRAGSLCHADVAVISRYDGGMIELAAIDGLRPEAIRIVRKLFPMRPDAQTMSAWVVRRGEVVHFADIFAAPDYEIKEFARAAGYRAALGVPIVRDQRVVGVVFVGRGAPGPFSDSQVEVIRIFADQAGIAIENVRLFNEIESRNAALTEALEQQTATSEILRVISGSPRDAQPVFDTIARAALTLCAANTALVARYDGALIHIAAVASTSSAGSEAVRAIFPRPPSPANGTTRAIHTGRTVMIPDVTTDPAFGTIEASLASGFRSVLAVPLKRGEDTIGCITVGRPAPGSFPDKQVALLQTFADQAVIAIENARLFRELEARTGQLTRSVDELRALSEVGQAVNSSLDLGTVLRTIVARARELTGMDGGSIYEYDAQAGEFHLHAADQMPQELVDALRESRMRRGEGALGRMAVTGRPVQIHDVADAAEYQSRVRDLLLRVGYRSLLAVPLRRDDRLLGGLVVNSARAGAFAPATIALLETFAAQSALALQNARLFREVEEKGRQLETASRHKSEFLANMSHELRTPLNAIIGFSDVLAQRLFGDVNAKQAEYLADIMESGQHLLALINEVLDLSKIEAGRMELDIAPFDARRTLDAALALVRERAQRRGVALACACDPQLGVLQADERKVKQVLLNLLSNALKFTPEGGRVDVRGAIDGRYARISVADTGVGIAPEDQDAVFEEFRQVGASSRKSEGTGLGLAISRKFVELHGGSMGVASTPGVGSTFWFTLPLG